MQNHHTRTLITASCFALPLLTATAPTYAGGGPESTLLIIDPSNPDSLYIGNTYKTLRGIPDRNVLYLDPTAINYASFVDFNQSALLGTLSDRLLDDHIDTILISATDSFYISASGYISDGCASVNRFALPSAYTMSHISDDIFGGLSSSERNQYAGTDDQALAFDSTILWYNGQPDDDPERAKQYFIGMQLGYTGELGNTVPEILDMIDRSASVDGTFPLGTFYLMETTDGARSGPRHDTYDSVVASIIALGGQAEHRCCSVLPTGEHDILGIMTGAASPDIDGTDMTILPGSFCDHLTSYAGRFDTTSQVKMSRWIANGASGSHGTVEEPCNYSGKFPHARIHLYYYSGLTLGEAAFRSLRYTPFQGLLLGDPLTRPYTHIPTVTLEGLTGEPISGIINITPDATTTHPTAQIESFDLLIDGVIWDTIQPGAIFHFDTTRFSDGYHELRVIAYDNTDQQSNGNLIDTIIINNLGRSLTITPDDTTGNWSTPFDITMEAVGGSVVEYRLIHNQRVITAQDNNDNPLKIYGATLGSAQSTVHGESLFDDGMIVRSEPTTFDISHDPGSPSMADPIASSYTRTILSSSPTLIELPTIFDDPTASLTWQIITPPTQAALLGTANQPYRLFQPDAEAQGTDSFTYQITSDSGQSEIETITITYIPHHFGYLNLEVGPLFGGETGTFTVTKAYPNENTYLAYSLRGEGETYIPQLNITLGLDQPKQAGEVLTSDTEGTAIWELQIPPVSKLHLIWLQAAQRSETSNIILTQVNK